MAVEYTVLFDPAALTTSAVTYYTVPTGRKLVGARIRLSNVTAGAVTATVHAVPSGGSAADSNAQIKGYSIGANDYVDLDIGTLEAGDTIQALAGAGTSITISAIDGRLFS